MARQVCLRPTTDRVAHDAARADGVEPASIADLWRRFTATGDARDREALILHYSPLVKFVAARVAAPRVRDIDDLLSSGVFGLIDAVERFDPERGVKFETFATPRIRGSILDWLRSMDWAPRSVRRKQRALDRVTEELAVDLGREPNPSEVAGALGLGERELVRDRLQVSRAGVARLDQLGDSTDDGVEVADETAAPDELVESRATRQELARAVSELAEREKLVVTLYFYEGLTLGQISEVLGVTESRSCQVLGAGVRHLRARLRDEGLLEPDPAGP